MYFSGLGARFRQIRQIAAKPCKIRDFNGGVFRIEVAAKVTTKFAPKIAHWQAAGFIQSERQVIWQATAQIAA